MPLVTPQSWGARDRPARFLQEFNPCHVPAGTGAGGRFATKGSAGCRTTGQAPAKESYRRPPVIRTDNLDHAVRLILQGHVVELTDVKKVNTVLTKLADMAVEAKKLGKDAPTYDLCQVTVPGTNVFCNDIVRTEDHPNGILREGMPQLGGEPVPGTPADKLPRKPGTNEVDGSAAFIEHCRSLGIKVDEGLQVPAAMLKASQAEMIGPKVAAMMVAKDFDPAEKPIFMSRDVYVVDGHHRWASVVGRDAEDGVLGDKPMNVIRVDAPITEVLKIANQWSLAFGIKPVAGVRRATNAS